MAVEEQDAQTIGELAREFRRFREDLKEDLAAIRAATESTVRRDVYIAEMKLIEARFRAYDTRIEAFEETRDRDKERTDRAIQLAVGGLIMPLITGIVLAIVTWIIAKNGG